MSKGLLLGLFLLVSCICLDVAINSQDYRCMVVYTNNEENHLKIDIKFPKLKTNDNRSHYEIVLINTDTEAQERFTIEHGSFRKEVQLAENVVYKICTMIVTQGRGQIQQYMEYNSGIAHMASIYNQHIEVPNSLLKIKDLHESYRQLVIFQYEMQHINETKRSTIQQQDFYFTTQNQKIKKIQFISFAELGAIILLGAYQFIRLKKTIETRQN